MFDSDDDDDDDDDDDGGGGGGGGGGDEQATMQVFGPTYLSYRPEETGLQFQHID